MDNPYNYIKEGDLHTVLFISRNKDNKNVYDFKQRSESFLTTKSVEELVDRFLMFAENGVLHEKSRMYVSVNTRDNSLIHKKLLHFLIDNQEYPMQKLESKIASIADSPVCARTRKWLFDVDKVEGGLRTYDLEELVDKVIEDGGFDREELFIKETVSGYAVIVPRGFDTREVLQEYPSVSLHRDGMLYVLSAEREVM